MAKINQAHYDYIERPKTCASDDFWDQVRRTVNGKPLSQEQLDLIFLMIRQALNFQQDDILLDLCCGNGRLGFEFFDEVREYLGADFSPSLIEIARENFERPPSHTFLLQEAQEYCREESSPERFTKLLCFGSFAYFSEAYAFEVLSLLRRRFTNLKRLFIGSIPDEDNANVFFNGREALPTSDHTSAIGRWYTRSGFTKLAESCGWKVFISEMPPAFYQAHYRFNSMLVPTGRYEKAIY
ncbi:class I SAM-dependent methyltransferase [Desulfobulbus sp.]|uniref:class I SAM-dependent methyltransferase n=1 Tax=Desulfobulbus sp. TaxID=895 RepID=UPI00286F273C|nr:class I SAM-dependent methyltransferase [Desulfobulbus sp.]